MSSRFSLDLPAMWSTRTHTVVLTLYRLEEQIGRARLVPGPAPPAPPPAAAFDLATGDSVRGVIAPFLRTIVPVLGAAGSDASLILRYTTFSVVAYFDALAPFHPTAVGIVGRVPRRPVAEQTRANRNIAILYSTHRAWASMVPWIREGLDEMLRGVGLDPDESRQDLTTPVGIGNYVGAQLVARLEGDGMNQEGDEVNPALTERTDQGRRYWDYTGYEPVNTAYRLTDASRWQPAIVDSGSGIFRVQQFVTPPWALTTPFSYSDPLEFSAPLPTASDPNNAAEYRAQADAVLRASAGLTDEQKMIAERFNNKLISVALAGLFIESQRNFTMEEGVFYSTALQIVEYDTGIAIWAQKRRYDAVRPFSAIRHLYGNSPVTAWGGPGRGTQSIPATLWRSYIPVSDHPEYPSASAGFCAAHAELAQLYLGSDVLNWFIPTMQGSSTIEPGVTPRNNIIIGWNTFTEFSTDCGNSRLWGGVHFPAAIPAGQAIGQAVGRRTYDFMMRHINGTP